VFFALFIDPMTLPWVDRSMFPLRVLGHAAQIAVKTALLGGFKQTEHNYLQHAKKTDDSSGSTAGAPICIYICIYLHQQL